MDVEISPAWVPQGRFQRGAEMVQLAFGAPRYIIGAVLVLAGMLTWMIITILHHHQVERHGHGHMMWCDAPNLTVSIGGGRGHFSSISAAVEAAPDFSPRRFCIHVKQGRYIEDVYINQNKTNLVLVGDGIGKTIIAGTSDCRSIACSIQQATLWVRANGFMAADISVENNKNGSAVAIVNRSDRSVLLRCSFSGQHGAVYAYYTRQLYRECQIDGAGFLITGELAVAIFQNCSVSLVKTAPESQFVVAAHSRDEAYEEGVFVFHQSVVSISGGTTTKPPPVLGLSLGAYSRIVYIQCLLNLHAGWSAGNFSSPTVLFGVYGNVGPGVSSLNSSVVQFLDREASSEFSVRNLFGNWLPADVPVALDLA